MAAVQAPAPPKRREERSKTIVASPADDDFSTAPIPAFPVPMEPSFARSTVSARAKSVERERAAAVDFELDVSPKPRQQPAIRASSRSRSMRAAAPRPDGATSPAHAKYATAVEAYDVPIRRAADLHRATIRVHPRNSPASRAHSPSTVSPAPRDEVAALETLEVERVRTAVAAEHADAQLLAADIATAAERLQLLLATRDLIAQEELPNCRARTDAARRVADEAAAATDALRHEKVAAESAVVRVLASTRTAASARAAAYAELRGKCAAVGLAADARERALLRNLDQLRADRDSVTNDVEALHEIADEVEKLTQTRDDLRMSTKAQGAGRIHALIRDHEKACADTQTQSRVRVAAEHDALRRMQEHVDVLRAEVADLRRATAVAADELRAVQAQRDACIEELSSMQTITK